MKNTFLIFCLVFSTAAFSQFSETGARADGIIYLNKEQSAEGSNAKKRGYYVGPHVLGDTITMLLNKFENDYVYYKVTGGAYNVEEKNVVKPTIYQAVRKLNRYYEKALTKGSITEPNAYVRMKSIIYKGLELKNYYTADVERKLKKLKKPEDIEKYLMSIRFR